MKPIDLSKEQAKEIAHNVYADISSYTQNNLERFVPWLIDEVRREKGEPPVKKMGGLKWH